MKKLFRILFISLTILQFNGCTNKQQQDSQTPVSGDIIIFHAGSLSVPFKQIADSFKTIYPNVNIILEASGSVDCARKITDLNRSCDIMASADYKVIDKMLIPVYAKSNFKFAANEMAIVYTDKSKYSNEINQQNWTEILLKNDVFYGRSDPNSDPCGYRSVFTIKLAEDFYKLPELATNLLDKDNNLIRPKETDLIALLETHTVDYIFLYRSVAEQHHLNYLILPDEINLKNPEMEALYSTATTEISGKTPGEKTTLKGEAMVYGVCMLKNAPNKIAAATFMKFLLNKDGGLKIMEQNGQPVFVVDLPKEF